MKTRAMRTCSPNLLRALAVAVGVAGYLLAPTAATAQVAIDCSSLLARGTDGTIPGHAAEFVASADADGIQLFARRKSYVAIPHAPDVYVVMDQDIAACMGGCMAAVFGSSRGYSYISMPFLVNRDAIIVTNLGVSDAVGSPFELFGIPLADLNSQILVEIKTNEIESNIYYAKDARIPVGRIEELVSTIGGRVGGIPSYLFGQVGRRTAPSCVSRR